jgi:hypothetical protein
MSSATTDIELATLFPYRRAPTFSRKQPSMMKEHQLRKAPEQNIAKHKLYEGIRNTQISHSA